MQRSLTVEADGTPMVMHVVHARSHDGVQQRVEIEFMRTGSDGMRMPHFSTSMALGTIAGTNLSTAGTVA